MSTGGGGLVSSLLVPLMGKSSRRSGLTEMGDIYIYIYIYIYNTYVII